VTVAMFNRAVITGVGVVSPFGIGAHAFFSGLEQGCSAIGTIASFDASAFPVTVAGEVTSAATDAAWMRHRLHELGMDAALLDSVSPDDRWRDRKTAFGLLAAIEAWRSAQCGQPERRAALVLALGLEQAFLQDFAPFFTSQGIDWQAERTVPGAMRFRSDVDLCAQTLTHALQLTGPTYINASACAAGGLALAHAASLIERGACEIVVCGGADSMVNPLGIGGMARLGAPSPRGEPDACRPFDSRRDGLVIGEGAAMFVVEAEQRALQRGVEPLAYILGHGSTQDAYRVTAPRPDGAAAAKAMQRALHRAQLDVSAIGYVNAHGTGTPLNDVAEACAIRTVFGVHADRLPVSSIKGAIGHLMAASGAIELAACLLPFRRGLLPGTAHHLVKDPLCDIHVIGEQPMASQPDAVLSNSFGFGGQNVAVILGRYR
jgi:3-oxoacyl-[acyl-carrier-protein] synthase II